MNLAAMALTVALVVQGQTPLRATSHDDAPRQTMLTPGDWLEVRGERQGYLQVYDHRRERPGYVRPAAVRTYAVDESSAPRVGAVVEYLRDAPGQESLGIGYVALYLRAAAVKDVGPEVFDALGTMAGRLARRASARVAKAGDATIAAELEVAESYGVHFTSFEAAGQTRVCYDGEAFRRVLAMAGAQDAARVRAALGLTDPACEDPALGQSAALDLVKGRAAVLAQVDPSTLGPDVSAAERARLRVRRATIDAELAYYSARGGDAAAAKDAGESATRQLALADRASLADDERLAYEEAALHVASVRWASEPPAPAASPSLAVEVAPGEPGQTCVRVKKRASPSAAPFEHCTYGVVWPASIRVAPHDAGVAMVVQPLAGWSELLVLRPGASGWSADTVTPATIDPDLGYVELAGFSPDGARLLVVREARASGPLGSPNTLAPWIQRAFQVVGTADLRVEKESRSHATFATFKRWEAADWRRGTLALR
jgi:hypothetical protein